MTELAARPIARGPVGFARDFHAAELGYVLELELDKGVVISWPKKRCPLLWFPEYRACAWMQGAKRGRKQAAPDEIARKVESAFERWADRPVRLIGTDTFPPRPKGQWLAYGRASRIDYWSDKWGTTAEYTHTITTSVRLYRWGHAKKPPWLWVLRGGGLQLTARGLIG